MVRIFVDEVVCMNTLSVKGLEFHGDTWTE